MDKAPLRRNLATVHVKWDTNQAILSGDVMAFIANECFLQAPESSFMKIFRVFNKSAAEVCEGQQLDMEFEKMPVISEDDYLKMIRLKTAVLIASSLKIGAYLGDASEQDAESLYEFGINLGLAFQIEDDILDIWGDTKIFGKAHGGDIAAGKKTYPFIKAMDLASPAEKRELKKLYTGRQSDIDSILSRVIAIYDSLNIREKCEVTSGEYNRKAFSCLEKVSVDPARKNELTTLASSLIGRVY
jgi:geranylgeranyl diphosphate synthase type II